jgi:predicted nucleic acid-binding protein
LRILIDSSAWIDFLNDYPSQAAEELARLLDSDLELCTCGLIVAEVTQGLRHEPSFREVVDRLQDLIFLEPDGYGTYVRAADVYRRLRQRGTTVRSTIDCLIAALAEEQGCAILARDRDLAAIVASGLLRTAMWGQQESSEVHEGE